MTMRVWLRVWVSVCLGNAAKYGIQQRLLVLHGCEGLLVRLDAVRLQLVEKDAKKLVRAGWRQDHSAHARP